MGMARIYYMWYVWITHIAINRDTCTVGAMIPLGMSRIHWWSRDTYAWHVPRSRWTEICTPGATIQLGMTHTHTWSININDITINRDTCTVGARIPLGRRYNWAWYVFIHGYDAYLLHVTRTNHSYRDLQGHLYCWGDDTTGQLGLGPKAGRQASYVYEYMRIYVYVHVYICKFIYVYI